MSGRGQGNSQSQQQGNPPPQQQPSQQQGNPPLQQQPSQQGNPRQGQQQQGNPQQQGQQPSQQQGQQPSQQQGQQPSQQQQGNSQQQGQQSQKRQTSFAHGTKGNSSQQSSRARSWKSVPNNLKQLMNIIDREGGIKDKEGKTNRETQNWVNERHEDAREILKHGANIHILELGPQARKKTIDENTLDDANAMERPAKIIDNIKEAIDNKDADKLNEIVNDYEEIVKSIRKLSSENSINITKITI